MNQALITQYAKRLEALLEQYAREDPEARLLAGSLEALIARAKAGGIDSPVAWNDIPGEYWFAERSLSQYEDLENAYTKFKMEISGQADDPQTQRILGMIKKMREGTQRGS